MKQRLMNIVTLAMWYYTVTRYYIDTGYEFSNIKDIKDIMDQIKCKKYRTEEMRTHLLKHWSEIYRIIRNYKIDLVTSPIVEYDPCMFA